MFSLSDKDLTTVPTLPDGVLSAVLKADGPLVIAGLLFAKALATSF
jgi:hypothetical protein